MYFHCLVDWSVDLLICLFIYLSVHVDNIVVNAVVFIVVFILVSNCSRRTKLVMDFHILVKIQGQSNTGQLS